MITFYTENSQRTSWVVLAEGANGMRQIGHINFVGAEDEMMFFIDFSCPGPLGLSPKELQVIASFCTQISGVERGNLADVFPAWTISDPDFQMFPNQEFDDV